MPGGWRVEAGRDIPQGVPLPEATLGWSIPPKYSTKSTLTRELVLGPNKLDFELKSK
jgi:hypothetical protein